MKRERYLARWTAALSSDLRLLRSLREVEARNARSRKSGAVRSFFAPPSH